VHVISINIDDDYNVFSINNLNHISQTYIIQII
jgi:hypothetical protein